MPVPKKLVLDAKEPVVDVSYVHGDPQHVVVAQLDHDFQESFIPKEERADK